MPRGFTKGDPRAVTAGQKGGQRSGKTRQWRTPDYILGYQAGARTERRKWQQYENALTRVDSVPGVGHGDLPRRADRR